MTQPGSAGRYLGARAPLDMGTQEGRVLPLTRLSYVPTAALLVRRAALTADGPGPGLHGSDLLGPVPSGAGPFDDDLRYGEDVACREGAAIPDFETGRRALEFEAEGIAAPGLAAASEGEPLGGWQVAFTAPFNFSGHPAATVRAGFTDAGLPAGLQIVAERHRDDLVLQASRAFEEAQPWNDRWPQL